MLEGPGPQSRGFGEGVGLGARHSGRVWFLSACDSGRAQAGTLRTHLQDHPLHEAHIVENGHGTDEENSDGQNLPAKSTDPGVRGREVAGYHAGPRRPQTATSSKGLPLRAPTGSGKKL